MWTLWNKVKMSSILVVTVPPFCWILCFIGGWCWCGIGGIPQHFFDTCISFCWKNVLVFSDRCTSVLQMRWLGEVVSNIDLLVYCFSIPSDQKIVGNLPPHGPQVMPRRMIQIISFLAKFWLELNVVNGPEVYCLPVTSD